MGLYDYTQIITGSDPEGTELIFSIESSAPVNNIPNTDIANDGVNTSTYSWDTTNTTLKVDGTITFGVVDVPGEKVIQTVAMESWFRPSINTVDDISATDSVEYTATIVVATHEPNGNLDIIFDFPGNDVPSGFSFIDNDDNTATLTWTPAGVVAQTTFDVIVIDNGPVPGGLVAQNQVSVLIESVAAPSVFTVSVPEVTVITGFVNPGQNMFALMEEDPVYTNGTPDTWLWEYLEWSDDGTNWYPPDASHEWLFVDASIENSIIDEIDNLNGILYKHRLTATVSGNGNTDSDEWVGLINWS